MRRMEAGVIFFDEPDPVSPDRPIRWCWQHGNVRANRVDRSWDVGVYAIDEVCSECGEAVEPARSEEMEG
jgi:hypothetical protein